jgi:putative endonuclease
MQYFVYILFSEKLNKYYIGSTGNIEDRLRKHNRSGKGFTSTGKPWILVYSEGFNSKAEALKRELQFKSWKNRERIEALIRRSDGISGGHTVGSEHPD